ncbi:MAG TPA: ABC transporter ATP-binding protein [Candidatus Acidoferrales bacterium]|nr:ABC transporter ATP-binding protein [Candidatus Acidoferrales bacterium]
MLIEVENLSKTFGDFTAVDNVSFGVERGEIVGMLGPNGAGKTTTIHMILGLITPGAGRISIFGKSMETHREEILQDLNFTSPYVAFPFRLTVLENLKIFARLYNVPRPRERIDELLELFGIVKLRDKAISRLSSGENTRVGLCKAFMNKPRLLLLDEPTAYLDPEIAWQVKNVLLEAQRENGTTILYTSHNMDEVERMCNRIVFLHHGKVVACGSPIEITQAILKEERAEPALEEVFMRLAREKAA